MYSQWEQMNQKLEALDEKMNGIIDGTTPANTQVTGSNVELDISRIDELITNQREIINTMHSDKLIFGAYWDKGSSPTLTRTDAAVGLVANVGVDGELVRNDFDKMPIWGEMEDAMDVYGNYYVKIPKFYIRRISGKDFHLTQVSKTRYPGFYLPFVFWDFENGKELDYYNHSKYKGSLSEDGKLESKPDKHPLVSRNIVQFRDYAKANNDDVNGVKGYQQFDVHAHDILNTLFTIEFATLHSQSIMPGFTSGRYHEADVVTMAEENTNRVIMPKSSSDLFVVGQSIGIGTSRGGQQIASARLVLDIGDHDNENGYIEFDGDPIDTQVGHYVYSNGWINGFSRDILASSGSIGDNTSGKYPCMYRGIESPWGDIYQFVDGININDHQTWVAENAEDYASNLFAHPYQKLGYMNIDSNVWVSEMGFDPSYPFAQFPTKGGGGSSTYYADHYYQAAGARIARVGGVWSSGSAAGLFVWILPYSSSSSPLILGGRLLKKAL